MELITRDGVDYEVAGHSLQDIVNYNEVAVAQVMREVLAKNLSLCQCRFCVEDVYALSLNALPARYIQPSSLRTYTTSRTFIDLEIVREKVLEAVSSVSKKPNHDP
jgi:hypothetical protein